MATVTVQPSPTPAPLSASSPSSLPVPTHTQHAYTAIRRKLLALRQRQPAADSSAAIVVGGDASVPRSLKRRRNTREFAPPEVIKRLSLAPRGYDAVEIELAEDGTIAVLVVPVHPTACEALTTLLGVQQSASEEEEEVVEEVEEVVAAVVVDNDDAAAVPLPAGDDEEEKREDAESVSDRSTSRPDSSGASISNMSLDGAGAGAGERRASRDCETIYIGSVLPPTIQMHMPSARRPSSITVDWSRARTRIRTVAPDEDDQDDWSVGSTNGNNNDDDDEYDDDDGVYLDNEEDEQMADMNATTISIPATTPGITPGVTPGGSVEVLTPMQTGKLSPVVGVYPAEPSSLEEDEEDEEEEAEGQEVSYFPSANQNQNQPWRATILSPIPDEPEESYHTPVHTAGYFCGGKQPFVITTSFPTTSLTTDDDDDNEEEEEEDEGSGSSTPVATSRPALTSAPSLMTIPIPATSPMQFPTIFSPLMSPTFEAAAFNLDAAETAEEAMWRKRREAVMGPTGVEPGTRLGGAVIMAGEGGFGGVVTAGFRR